MTTAPNLDPKRQYLGRRHDTVQRTRRSASHGAGLSKVPLTKWHRALGGETAALVGPVTEGLERQDETALQLIKISDF